MIWLFHGYFTNWCSFKRRMVFWQNINIIWVEGQKTKKVVLKRKNPIFVYVLSQPFSTAFLFLILRFSRTIFLEIVITISKFCLFLVEFFFLTFNEQLPWKSFCPKLLSDVSEKKSYVFLCIFLYLL